MAKPKKGVMPPALKRYWASRRKKRKVVSKKKRTRSKNPQGIFKLIATKGSQRLTYNGLKFSSGAKAVLFTSKAAAEEVARNMVRKHPSLRSYKFFATTR